MPGLLYRGKVRDMYDLGNGRLIMVATDRISAFDVVMPDPIPGKGALLARMCAFWFKLTKDLMPNHLLTPLWEWSDIGMRQSNDALNVPSEFMNPELSARSLLVRKAKRIDMECIARGYLTGSAWNEYSRNGTVNNAPLPMGLTEASKLSEPIFTPSTKALTGHDRPLSRREGKNLIGKELYRRLEDMTLELFVRGSRHVEGCGMLLADTKFEFGFTDNQLILIDEALTTDSSRFWDATDWKRGSSPEPFDKQYLRNWLENQRWDKRSPAPSLPQEIIINTFHRYEQAYQRLTGDASPFL